MSPSSTFAGKREINCHRVIHVNDLISGFLWVILDIGFLAFCTYFSFGQPVQLPNVILKVLLSVMLEIGCLGTICNFEHNAQDAPVTNVWNTKKSRNITGFCLQDEHSSCLHFRTIIIMFQHLKLVGWTNTANCVYSHRYSLISIHFFRNVHQSQP